MAIPLPYSINPGDDILAERLQANFDALSTHKVVDDDVSSLAALQGSKIAQNTLPGDRIAVGTIDSTRLGASSVLNAALAALAVTKDKLSITSGQKVTLTQLEAAVWSPTTQTINLSTAVFYGITCDIGQTTIGGINSWFIRAQILSASGVATSPPSTFVGHSLYNLNPATAIPVSTTQPIGVVVKNVSGTTGTITFDVDFLYIAKS